MMTPFKPLNVSEVFLLLIAIGILGCTRQLTTKAEMEAEFNAEFGFPPPASITGYQCSVDRMGDALATWFTFQGTDDIFEKLHTKEFSSTQLNKVQSVAQVWYRDVEMGDSNAPKWWPGVPKSEEIFWKEWHSHDGAGHFIYFWRIAATGKVYSKCGDWQ